MSTLEGYRGGFHSVIDPEIYLRDHTADLVDLQSMQVHFSSDGTFSYLAGDLKEGRWSTCNYNEDIEGIVAEPIFPRCTAVFEASDSGGMTAGTFVIFVDNEGVDAFRFLQANVYAGVGLAVQRAKDDEALRQSGVDVTALQELKAAYGTFLSVKFCAERGLFSRGEVGAVERAAKNAELKLRNTALAEASWDEVARASLSVTTRLGVDSEAIFTFCRDQRQNAAPVLVEGQQPLKKPF